MPSPRPSESDGNQAPTIPSRRGFFSRTLSSASFSSLASVSTVGTFLPTYSIEDPSEVGSIATSSTDRLDTSTVYSLSSSTEVDSNASVNTLRPLSSPPPIAGLPRYSHIPPQYSSTSEWRPSGGSSVQHIEHSFPIRSNKPWATLCTFSRDLGEPQPKGKVPRFWGGELVAGTVDLDLTTSTTIQQISITLQGKISTAYRESEGIFLNHEVLLYHQDTGEPHPSSAPLQTHNSTRRTKFDGKFLPGSYQFPFSIPFPAQVDLKLPGILPSASVVRPFSDTSPGLSPIMEKGYPYIEPKSAGRAAPVSSIRSSTSPQTSRMAVDLNANNEKGKREPRRTLSNDSSVAAEITLETPQSFMENGVIAMIFYELVVRVVHGRFRPDNKIKAPIVYIPAVVAQPVFLRRRQAYENAALIPGPHSDPEGWLSLPTTVLRGTLIGNVTKNIAIECSLYLAKPLSYTRGSHIPLYLRLSSQDAGTLSALCTPKSPLVRLMRLLTYLSSREEAEYANMVGNAVGAINYNGNGGLLPTAAYSEGRRLNVSLKQEATAVWWNPPMKGTGQRTGVMWLEGELHLPQELKATNNCTLFSIEYFVELLPLRSHEFQPALNEGVGGDPRKQVLASHCVQVATLHAPDTPIPVAFTEPPKTRSRDASQ